MFVKLPMWLMTLRNWSAAPRPPVNAAMPPELAPQMPRLERIGAQVVGLPDLGQQLIHQEARVLVPERVVLGAAVVRAPGVAGQRLPR